MEYVAVGRVEELPAGKGTVFTVADKQLAIFNVDGTFMFPDTELPLTPLRLLTDRSA